MDERVRLRPPGPTNLYNDRGPGPDGLIAVLASDAPALLREGWIKPDPEPTPKRGRKKKE